MKAVIMAGGEGTRLRPLTSMRPKPMVPIVNQPIMEHILGLVKHHGIDEVVATLAFMPQVIQDYFGAGDEWGMSISYAIEESPLGTAGSVKNAQAALDDTFLVISGDALTDINLREVIQFHRERGGLVTIALKRVDDPLEFGVVVTDKDGRIERFLEKPSWGQVFSDTINTGIYVIEPRVFDFIPDDEPFDFSSQVFPLLMENGYDLYGCVVDGYWCDVGSLGSYVQAHRDVLDGKAMIFVPGVKAKNDSWVGPGAEIDPDAHIGDKVVIGANTRVRAGAKLGEYSVIGDNCLLGYDTNLQHSIVWNDCFVGAGSELRGAVVCRNVDIRARARLNFGSVIGDEATIGHGATIGNDVQIYPFKRIDPAAVVNSSLIWESRGLRSLFGTDGISGLVNIDITPGLALKTAQAYGSVLPAKSHVVVSRDSSRAARMIKRAMVAGLNATGVHVRDLRVASPAVTRFTTRETRCLGGLHVGTSPTDAQTLEIHLYDKDGIDVGSWVEKKVERLFFREEFRRAFFTEVGEIIYPPRALEYYVAGLCEALDCDAEPGRRMTLVADMGFSPASVVLPQSAVDWGIELVSLRPFVDAERTSVTQAERDTAEEQLIRSVDVFQADIGVQIDSRSECVTLVTPNGRVLDPDTALHALVSLFCRSDETGGAVVVPLSASRVIEDIAERAGRAVIRCGASRKALFAAAGQEGVGFAGSRDGGYVFPEFLAAYDAVMTVGALVRMLRAVGDGLDAIVDELPEFQMREQSVFCPYDRKGAVMRAVAEAVEGQQAQMTEGVRVVADDGWALVLPHAVEPRVDVYAEGDDDAAALRLLTHFVDIVTATVAEGT